MSLDALIFLLINYFGSEKHVKSLAVINCMDQNSNFKLSNSLSMNGFSVVNILLHKNTSITIPTYNMQNFSKDSNLLGVYLDFNCKFAEKVIQSVDISFIFKIQFEKKNNFPFW